MIRQALAGSAEETRGGRWMDGSTDDVRGLNLEMLPRDAAQQLRTSQGKGHTIPSNRVHQEHAKSQAF
jgi:hypothetical protein